MPVRAAASAADHAGQARSRPRAGPPATSSGTTGACDGFVTSVEQTVAEPEADPTAGMGYWTEADLPFYYGLARTFPLATRWFCSCLGPTFPNRRFLIAGTANGLIDDLPFGMIDYPAKGTIFDLLTAHGISWANYHMLSPARFGWRRLSHAHGLRLLRLLGGVVAAFVPAAVPRCCPSCRSPPTCIRSACCARSTTSARWTASGTPRSTGTLPSVSIVDPDFSYCSEENPQDIAGRRGVRGRGHQRGDERPGLGQDAADLALRRARRLLRPRAAAGRACRPTTCPARSSFERYRALRLLKNTKLGQEVARANAGPAHLRAGWASGSRPSSCRPTPGPAT